MLHVFRGNEILFRENEILNSLQLNAISIKRHAISTKRHTKTLKRYSDLSALDTILARYCCAARAQLTLQRRFYCAYATIRDFRLHSVYDKYVAASNYIAAFRLHG